MSKVLTHTCTGACMRDVPGSINFESWGKCPREKGHQKISVFHSTSFFHQSVPGCKEIVPALIVFTGLFPVGTQYKRKPYFLSKHGKKTIKKCRLNDTFLYGGEIGKL